MSSRPKPVQDWLDKAKEDEDTVAAIRAYGGPWPMAAYHLQQAAEKLVKALLQAGGTVPPAVHDVGFLLNRLSVSIVPADVQLAANTVTPFATHTRYPGFAPITEADVDQGEAHLLKIKTFCLSEIDRLFP